MTSFATSRRCRICGCTDDQACIDDDGLACFWIAEDLCSACVGEAGSRAVPSEHRLRGIEHALDIAIALQVIVIFLILVSMVTL